MKINALKAQIKEKQGAIKPKSIKELAEDFCAISQWKCKNCKHWTATPETQGQVKTCTHEALSQMITKGYESSGASGMQGGLIAAHCDFGCIHFEAKE